MADRGETRASCKNDSWANAAIHALNRPHCGRAALLRRAEVLLQGGAAMLSRLEVVRRCSGALLLQIAAMLQGLEVMLPRVAVTLQGAAALLRVIEAEEIRANSGITFPAGAKRRVEEGENQF
jgi:hypothetical protein